MLACVMCMLVRMLAYVGVCVAYVGVCDAYVGVCVAYVGECVSYVCVCMYWCKQLTVPGPIFHTILRVCVATVVKLQVKGRVSPIRG